MQRSSNSEAPQTIITSRARSLLETYDMTETYSVRKGRVQHMVYHKDYGKLGGFSAKPRGQYILATQAFGRIKSSRMRELGFHIQYRSNGSPYWYRAGHSNVAGFAAAVGEMAGTAPTY